MNRHTAGWLVLATLAGVCGVQALINWWKFPPPVEFDNLRYIQLLRTAISAERPDWVAKVREAIELRSAAGAMSARERTHFEHLLSQADQGRWKDAAGGCFRFEEAQLYRRRKKPPALVENHLHEH